MRQGLVVYQYLVIGDAKKYRASWVSQLPLVIASKSQCYSAVQYRVFRRGMDNVHSSNPVKYC